MPKATKYRIRRFTPGESAARMTASAPVGTVDGSAALADPLPEMPGLARVKSGDAGTETLAKATAKAKAQKAPKEASTEATRATATPPEAQGATPPQSDDPAAILEPQDDGFGEMIFPTAAASDAGPQVTTASTVGLPGKTRRGHQLADDDATVLGPSEMTADEEIATIRQEGLTGRQLRLARRMAQKHGIEATSDFDAVRLLRRQGIDPFDRSNILQMVRPTAEGAAADAGDATTRALAQIDGAGADTRVQLPQTLKPGQVPAAAAPAAAMTEDHRASEIIRIQRDIAQRRRRKLLLLAVRLAFFVFLPTIIAGYYYYAVATPLYATKSEFVIQKADGLTTGGSGMSSLLSGTQFATNQDAITVQSYLSSRDAMLRLDNDLHFKQHFSTPELDPLQGLEPGSTNEQAYKVYKRNVKIGYDPSEGIIKMEVIAPNPDLSRQFSEKLISYAEEQVDRLTARLREDQMKGARESYDDAEAKVFAAQSKVLELQQKMGIMDPVSETSLVMGQISGFETQLQQKRLELGQLLSNARPSSARVEGVKGDIARLEELIGTLRAQLTVNSGGTESLAAVTGQLRIAEAELETRQSLLAAAAQLMETARIEANKQVRYLEMGVRPIAPDEPTYPRAFENTLLAFLIFSGIYLMLSLTASVLREQVSS